MRHFLTAPAFAGALAAVCSPASAQASADVLRALPATYDVRAIIVEAALVQGVDPRLALAVARIESKFNPRARGAQGEYCLFQIKCQMAWPNGRPAETRNYYKNVAIAETLLIGTGSVSGMSGTATVRNAAGSGTTTFTISGGIITGVA
jgi:Transglycosylase SLT domain